MLNALGTDAIIPMGTRACTCGFIMNVCDIYYGIHDLPRENWGQVNGPVEVAESELLKK